MKRRELLNLLGLSSVALSYPFMMPKLAFAATQTDRLWVMIRASAGWDPVSFCNPRSSNNYVITDVRGNSINKGPMTHYPQSFVEQIGNIKYAPAATTTGEQSYGNFVKKYYRELLVINGIEMNTNNHDTAHRLSLSGGMGTELPAFSAYAAAAVVNESLPLNYVSGGGYSNTAGLTPKVQLSGISQLNTVSDTNLSINTAEVFNSDLFSQLETARLQRIQRQLQNSKLPREKIELNQFYDAHLSIPELKALKAKMPTLSADRRFINAQQVCAAMAAGLTASAQIVSDGNWDTHSDHDNRINSNLKNLFEMVDFLKQEALRQNIADRMNIVITSDFGRTPYFNNGNGKDHWTVGSMLCMGPDFDGNRYIDLTNNLVQSIPVDINTFAPDANGEKITMQMVQKTLRAVTGTLNSAIDLANPINAKVVPKLFKA